MTRSHGDGFSVSYGNLGAGVLGEHGGGSGLRVSFRTRAYPSAGGAPGEVLGVSVGGRLLHERWLNAAAGDPAIRNT
eukprot:3330072-Prymnesium_polylepis.1